MRPPIQLLLQPATMAGVLSTYRKAGYLYWHRSNRCKQPSRVEGLVQCTHISLDRLKVQFSSLKCWAFRCPGGDKGLLPKNVCNKKKWINRRIGDYNNLKKKISCLKLLCAGYKKVLREQMLAFPCISPKEYNIRSNKSLKYHQCVERVKASVLPALLQQSSRSDHWKVFAKKNKVPFTTYKQENSFWVMNRELEKLPLL